MIAEIATMSVSEYKEAVRLASSMQLLEGEYDVKHVHMHK